MRQAMYDEKNLYLGYRVWAPNGPRNVGSELPYAPFVSGAYVDFYVAPDWRLPQRDRVFDGDVRVLVAWIGKDMKAGMVFQQGFWQICEQGEHPWEITSPAATVHFDNITEVPGLEAAYKAENADPTTGRVPYTVEVAVPLESLGLDDPAGRSIGFDVSVGVADDSGAERTRAAHWAGLTEGRVVDRPGSTRLLPHTWGTLRFVVE